jgi:drug/metabolite transporter (DMT)-like permease
MSPVRSDTLMLLTTVTVTTAGAAVLVPLGGWRPPSGHALGLLVLAAVLILIGYQCIIVSLRTGDISAVAPFGYSALLWAMLLGYLTFGPAKRDKHGSACRRHRHRGEQRDEHGRQLFRDTSRGEIAHRAKAD